MHFIHNEKSADGLVSTTTTKNRLFINTKKHLDPMSPRLQTINSREAGRIHAT